MVITWTMFYLLSGSSWHARIYKEAIPALRHQVFEKRVPAKVSFGASCFPYDVGYIPIWWARATVAENIVSWKEHSTGGHFPAVECGDALNADILEFVSRLPEPARLVLRSPHV